MLTLVAADTMLTGGAIVLTISVLGALAWCLLRPAGPQVGGNLGNLDERQIQDQRAQALGQPPRPRADNALDSSQALSQSSSEASYAISEARAVELAQQLGQASHMPGRLVRCIDAAPRDRIGHVLEIADINNRIT